MKFKVIILLMAAITVSSLCFAQSREPSMGSESSSTGVWPSVDSGPSVGYDSSDHGNVS